MSSEVPDGWSKATLGEVTTVKARIGWRGLAASEYTEDGPFLIAGKHIRSGTIDWAKCDHLSTFRYDESPEIQLRAGDVILSKDGSIGNPALIEELPGPATINGTMMMVRSEKSHLEPSYLYQVVCGADFNRMIREKVSGSSIPHIFQRDIVHFPVVLPPLEEQRWIAEVLRSVDEAIATNAALLNGVKAAKQGAMEAALSEGFDEVLLETLLADTRYPMRSGPFGSALLKSELQPEGIPFLGIDNVHVERFMPVYRRFVSDEKYRELARYTVFPGDVMVTIMGTVGRCCVVPPDVGVAISSKHVWTLTIDQDRYSPALLAWQINHSPAVLAQLQGSAQGGIMSAISSGTLRELLVPLPSPDEVREIEDLLLSFNRQIAALEAEQEAANAMKAALMSDLLSGRVRVPSVEATSPKAKTVPAAFKRAVFAAEVVHQLHRDQKFGSVKHEKIVHLCELHLDLHTDLDRHAYKKAAGPYDPSARRSVERILRDQKWFATSKPDGKRVVYTPLEKVGGHQTYYSRYFGERQLAIQSIINLLRPLGTEQCEIVATLYAVWNDFLLDGRQPTDDEIVASVLNEWHPSKKQIAEGRWRDALPWMRKHELVPRGTGEKTRVPA